MAPPRKGGAAASEQAKERLTAVVMADSFTQKFRPVSAEHPKVLYPLVNVPMLDYVLEWLSMNCIEEVFVFCCAHAEEVQSHLETAGWTRSKKLAIHPVVSTNCLSMGDALRLLDHKDCVKTDFVLVSGDVITNMNLAPALDAHLGRRAADKSAIMTLVMKSGMTAGHRVRLGASGVTTVIDPGTNRLLKYEELPGPGEAVPPTRRKGLRLDAALFSERDDISIRSDLIETGVYICAPEVLMLFSDNFDYQNIKRDFASGVLSEEELGNKLFVHAVSKDYVARVHSFRSYDAVSRDVMARWTYPLVPDTNLFGVKGSRMRSAGGDGGADRVQWGPKGKRTSYRYNPGMVYLDDDVTVERSAHVTNSSTIGAGTYVAETASVQQSVIGRNCHIGAGAILKGCYLGDNVVISQGVVATSAMLCDGVVVKEYAHVEPNVVLSFKVVVDRRMVVPAGAKVSLVRPPLGGTSGIDSEDELEVPQGSTHSPKGRYSTGGGGGGGGYSTGFGSSFSDEDSDGEGGFGGSGGGDGVDLLVLQAAGALASDGIPETSINFTTEVVGAMGAGFLWPALAFEGTPEAAALGGFEPPLAALQAARDGADDEEFAEEEEVGLATEASAENLSGGGSGSMTSPEAAAAAAAEPLFKREVAETFLRCVKENISHENVVIELNGLKIAEDKTFADCARFMLTTALGLCLPAPLTASREYRSLYNAGELDAQSKEGKLELLRRAAAQLKRWTDLLQKFLKNEEDQVELLLTLEEFCGEEGDFEGTGEQGVAYAGIFPQLLKLLYELDIAGEEAILAWADEKTHADEDEKRFLRLAQPFLDWLQEAEEESSSGEEESEEEE